MYRFKGRWAKFVVQTTLCCSKYKIQVIPGGSSSVLFVLSVERMLGVAVFPRRNISTVRRWLYLSYVDTLKLLLFNRNSQFLGLWLQSPWLELTSFIAFNGCFHSLRTIDSVLANSSGTWSVLCDWRSVLRILTTSLGWFNMSWLCIYTASNFCWLIVFRPTRLLSVFEFSSLSWFAAWGWRLLRFFVVVDLRS